MAKKVVNTAWFGIPSDRQTALKIGHKYYFTGKPCTHGHLSHRDAKDRKCLECELIYVRKRSSRPEVKERLRTWCAKNRDKRQAASKKCRAKYPERVTARMRDWYERNKEAQAAKKAAWRAANKSLIYAANAARRGREIQATPPWADQYKDDFTFIYAERDRISRETGIPHHVDHIYPLRGKDSCGLHVPWNLRIIPAVENLKKRNKPPSEDTIKSLTGSGLRSHGEALKSNAVHAD